MRIMNQEKTDLCPVKEQAVIELEKVSEIAFSVSQEKTLSGIFNVLSNALEKSQRVNITALFLYRKGIENYLVLESSKDTFGKNSMSKFILSESIISQLKTGDLISAENAIGGASSARKILNAFDCQLLVPILVQERLFGVLLCHVHDKVEKLSNQDKNLLKVLTLFSGMAIRALRDNESLEDSKRSLAKKVFELESVGEVGRILTKSLDLTQVIHSFLLSIMGYLGAESGCFFLFNSNEKSFFHKTSIGYPKDIENLAIDFTSETLAILETGKFFVKQEKMPGELNDLIEYLGVEMCFPVVFSNEIIGLSFFGEKAIGTLYKEEELSLASLLVSQASAPLRNSQLYVQLFENNKELKSKREELESTNLILQQKSSELEIANQMMSKEILERKLVENQVKKLNDELENRVIQRTSELHAVNDEMKKTLEVLQETQEELVQAEKMASLGSLVAGVAHEINTPIGVSVTAASFLKDKIGEFQLMNSTHHLKRSDLEGFIKTCSESSDMVLSNLKRAAGLVSSFKEVSTDHLVESSRMVNIHGYLENIVISLKPKLENSKITILILGDKTSEFFIDPSVLTRVLTTLAMNSLIHAFSPGGGGEIKIEYHVEKEGLFIVYTDNGKGIKGDHLKKIFDPFFTTNRGQGGTGLGLHIIFNLITQKLKGSIKVESKPNQGAVFYVKIPTIQP